MNRILAGVRPLDYVLTTVMVALAVLIALENIHAGTDSSLVHPIESHSALMVPVFALAALPILWRRRGILEAIVASTLVLAASVPMFGWVTRCGFALPLAIAMAYAVPRFARGRGAQLLGVGGVVLLQVVSLVKDASAGLGALALSLPLTVVAYGIGWYVQSRASRTGDATLTPEHVPA